MADAQERQRAYYGRTAADYDDAHLREGDEHYIALEYAVALAGMAQAETVLDVGCGTGRACRFLASRAPELKITGIEPVPELLARARAAGGATYLEGSGDNLPFGDRAFDVVCATGVLHHVKDPVPVVAEMLRVASRAVIISDNNRFGQGRMSVKVAKLMLYRLGVWPAFDYVRTRGKGHMWSEGDGVFHSYSVYDSLPQLADWGSRTLVLGTSGGGARLGGPLLSSPHALAVAIREDDIPGFARWGAA